MSACVPRATVRARMSPTAIVAGLLSLPTCPLCLSATGSAGPPLRLAAAEARDGDLFGSAVAVAEHTVLVGAPGTGDFLGAAYVFERRGEGWVQTARLHLEDAMPGSQLGAAVALASDTALLATSSGARTAGVYAFLRDAARRWTYEGPLSLPSGEAPQAVALAGDTAVVGTNGAAYVFVHAGAASWLLRGMLSPDPGETASAGFGASVAITPGLIAVGAPTAGRFSGAVYLFVRAATGQWIRQARLRADPSEFSLFGSAVALAGDQALVGAYGESNFHGAAYLLQHRASGWQSVARLAPDDAARSYECFGRALALSATSAVVGSPCSDPGEPIDVAVYQYRAGPRRAWDQRTRLGPAPAAAVENFATSVATTGELTVMGSPEEGSIGAAYVVECAGCQEP